MRVVVALGGNALMRRGDSSGEADTQLARAVDTVAELAQRHEVVVTHGNGPQVGLLALQAEAYDPDNPTPLDILGAESEGLIGYLLERELRSRIPGADVATLLTQVVVRSDDPAFRNPSKPIGPVYSEEQARALARERGWEVGRDGEHWRRVVPSPTPFAILEADTIGLLVDNGVLVVCAGGGGIPVVVGPMGRIAGVEAVVDKDATASLLARTVRADALLLLTDVPGVLDGWGTEHPRVIPHMTPSEAASFPAATGSMEPKLRACADFVTATGGLAAVGAVEDGLAVLEGRAGTRIEMSGTG